MYVSSLSKLTLFSLSLRRLEANVAELEQHIQQSNMVEQINGLHDKVLSYKRQIIQERNETASKLSDALHSQKYLFFQHHYTLVLTQHPPFNCRRVELQLEETRRQLDYAQMQLQRGSSVGGLGDAERYQKQYIEALAAVENYTTLSAKYDRRIKLARMHLEVCGLMFGKVANYYYI